MLYYLHSNAKDKYWTLKDLLLNINNCVLLNIKAFDEQLK